MIYAPCSPTPLDAPLHTVGVQRGQLHDARARGDAARRRRLDPVGHRNACAAAAGPQHLRLPQLKAEQRERPAQGTLDPELRGEREEREVD